jgi:ribosomal peptide maturation radical SAM protein 1
LDASPLPEYRDYVLQREKLSSNKSSGKERYPILFETSRGCGYGKCTFCGLNGKNNLIRIKSPDTIIQNLKTLVAHHNTNVIVMTDNMMPYRYFETLIPRISTGIPPIRIIYEMKVDLTLDQVLSLKKANITFRPGIESLSPSLLRRMNKPYTVRGNIALLRYSRSAGMDVEWALLFGFPGDIIGEYEEMTSLLPLIRHLQPPKEMVPLMLSRYSRYHRSPGMFAISNLQPAEALKDSLPSHADLDKAAYFFSAEFPSQSRENPEIITALWEEYQVWKHSWAIFKTIPSETLLPTLHVHRKNQKHYVLEDTRGLPGRPKRMEIDGDRASLILVSRPLETVPAVDLHWAADAGLGVVRESWFIPLATAEPILLQEFERDYKQDV